MKRNRNTTNLAWYIKEINKFPLLSREEEIELVRDIGKGHDTKCARDKLICSNLRLAFRIAISFSKIWNIDVKDLINESNKGLTEFVNHIG